jgi:hypothetical protein
MSGVLHWENNGARIISRENSEGNKEFNTNIISGAHCNRTVSHIGVV